MHDMDLMVSYITSWIAYAPLRFRKDHQKVLRLHWSFCGRLFFSMPEAYPENMSFSRTGGTPLPHPTDKSLNIILLLSTQTVDSFWPLLLAIQHTEAKLVRCTVVCLWATNLSLWPANTHVYPLLKSGLCWSQPVVILFEAKYVHMGLYQLKHNVLLRHEIYYT